MTAPWDRTDCWCADRHRCRYHQGAHDARHWLITELGALIMQLAGRRHRG